LDTTTAQSTVTPLKQGRILATRTHGVINLSKKVAIVEYSHKGAKARDIELVLSSIASAVFAPDTHISLQPIAGESFMRMIDSLDIVRLATLKLRRPNPGWTDCSNAVNELSKDSGGDAVEISIGARRNDALSKRRGLVGWIRHLISGNSNALHNAIVKGRYPGSSSVVTINLNKHIQSETKDVQIINGQLSSTEICRYLDELYVRI
jgi:hypothetical protein